VSPVQHENPAKAKLCESPLARAWRRRRLLLSIS